MKQKDSKDILRKMCILQKKKTFYEEPRQPYPKSTQRTIYKNKKDFKQFEKKKTKTMCEIEVQLQ